MCHVETEHRCAGRSVFGMRIPAGHVDTGLPARCAATIGRANRGRLDSAPSQRPGDHGVRVPHLSGPELVPTPDGSWDAGHFAKEPASDPVVRSEPQWTLHGFGDVGYPASPPNADLVAEDSRAARRIGRRRGQRPQRHDLLRIAAAPGPARSRRSRQRSSLGARSGRGRVAPGARLAPQSPRRPCR